MSKFIIKSWDRVMHTFDSMVAALEFCAVHPSTRGWQIYEVLPDGRHLFLRHCHYGNGM